MRGGARAEDEVLDWPRHVTRVLTWWVQPSKRPWSPVRPSPDGQVTMAALSPPHTSPHCRPQPRPNRSRPSHRRASRRRASRGLARLRRLCRSHIAASAAAAENRPTNLRPASPTRLPPVRRAAVRCRRLRRLRLRLCGRCSRRRRKSPDLPLTRRLRRFGERWRTPLRQLRTRHVAKSSTGALRCAHDISTLSDGPTF